MSLLTINRQLISDIAGNKTTKLICATAAAISAFYLVSKTSRKLYSNWSKKKNKHFHETGAQGEQVLSLEKCGGQTSRSEAPTHWANVPSLETGVVEISKVDNSDNIEAEHLTYYLQELMHSKHSNMDNITEHLQSTTPANIVEQSEKSQKSRELLDHEDPMLLEQGHNRQDQEEQEKWISVGKSLTETSEFADFQIAKKYDYINIEHTYREDCGTFSKLSEPLDYADDTQLEPDDTHQLEQKQSGCIKNDGECGVQKSVSNENAGSANSLCQTIVGSDVDKKSSLRDDSSQATGDIDISQKSSFQSLADEHSKLYNLRTLNIQSVGKSKSINNSLAALKVYEEQLERDKDDHILVSTRYSVPSVRNTRQKRFIKRYSETKIPMPDFHVPLSNNRKLKQEPARVNAFNQGHTDIIGEDNFGLKIQQRANIFSGTTNNHGSGIKSSYGREFRNTNRYFDNIELVSSTSIKTLKDSKTNDRIKMGSGTFAKVYLCTMKTTGELCVLKEYGKKFSQHEFETEISVLASMRCSGYTPQILGIIKTKPDDPVNGMILEFLGDRSTGECLTLYDFLLLQYKLAKIQWLQLCQELAVAIDMLHKQNVIHGDIKSRNIIINWHEGRWKPYIIDFRQSTTTDNPYNFVISAFDTKRWFQRHAGETPPPEVMAGGLVSQASDVYSFGVCLQDVMIAKSIPELSEIIQYCMDNFPTRRPCMSDITTELHNIIDSQNIW